MICAVMALLFTLGTEIFASQMVLVPTSKRNGMMDKIRDKVEQGVRDIEDGLTTSTVGGETTSVTPGAQTSSDVADPATSTTPETTKPSTTKDETTTTKEDVKDTENSKGFNWWGVLIAVAIAAAVVILIIALLPKK